MLATFSVFWPSFLAGFSGQPFGSGVQSGAFGEIFRPETFGKKLAKREPAHQPIRPTHKHRRVRPAELADSLTAGAAGRAQHATVAARHRNFGNPCSPGHHHRGDGACLGAVADRIGGVLDIGPDMKGACLVADRGADRKP